MAPSAIVIGAGVAAVAIVAGAALPVVVVAGALGWGTKVAVALPRRRRERIDPSALSMPWRGFVVDALDAQTRYGRASRQATAGPLRDRLVEIGTRVDAGVTECWHVAQRGDSLGAAIAGLDVAQARQELERARTALAARPTATGEQTVDALQAKVDSADRLTTVANDAVARLELLNARLDEAVARAVELSNRADEAADVGGLGGEIEGVVGELESLGAALDEATGTRRSTAE